MEDTDAEYQIDGLIAIAALLGAASVANTNDGTISITIFKAGFIVGGSAGSGVLTFPGRRLSAVDRGLSYGFTFGASETHFHGTVSNIRRPSDVAGVFSRAAPAQPPSGARRPSSSPTKAAPC